MCSGNDLLCRLCSDGGCQYHRLVPGICYPDIIAFITILFSIPPNELAGWSMIILVVFMFLYWQPDAKKRFRGPTKSDEAELRRIEGELVVAAKGQGDDSLIFCCVGIGKSDTIYPSQLS